MQRLWSVLGEVFWLAVAVAVLAGGVIVFQLLGQAREDVVAQPLERAIPVVQTEALTPYGASVPIRGEGFIRPHRSLTIASETGGRIVTLHPAIDERGSFNQGDVLVRLDDRNANATVNQIRANVRATQARLELTETELGRAETLRADGIIAQNRIDQLLSQKVELIASIDSLEASLEAAELALDKTIIRAPFAGRVLDKQADPGSVIGAGQAIADVYSDDVLEVDVALREAEAALVPGLFGPGGASATVAVRFAGQDHIWNARVERVEGRLDPDIRTLTVTVRIDNPDGTVVVDDGARPVAGAVPALINALARVEIEGPSFDDLYAIATTSLRNNETVWLDEGGTLGIHPVRPVHIDGAIAYVRAGGLPADARLITSPLQVAEPGLAIRAELTQARADAEATQ